MKKTHTRRVKGTGPAPHIVRPGGSVGGPPGRHVTPGFLLRAPQEEIDAWTARAAAESVTRNGWLRALANAAAAAESVTRNGWLRALANAAASKKGRGK